MKQLITGASVAAFVCSLLAAGFITGCEEVQQNQDITISLSDDPISGVASVTCVASLTTPLSNSSNAISTLFLPLEWSVGNPSLGNIASSEGYSAVYVSTTNAGGNTISVKDQRGDSGTIGITQTAPTTTVL